MYTAYQQIPSGSGVQFLANIDLTFYPPIQGVPPNKDINTLFEIFNKYNIGLENYFFIFETEKTNKAISEIFKEKYDKMFQICVSIQPSNQDNTKVVYNMFEINVIKDADTLSRKDVMKFSSIDPASLYGVVSTGVGRMIHSHNSMISKETYDNIPLGVYSGIQAVKPLYRYDIPTTVLDIISKMDYPYELMLNTDILTVENITTQRLNLQNKTVQGSISISKNMLVKEILKSQCPVSLYIYEILGQPNTYLFRFQGITGNMVISTDGFTIAVL
jgi:hypothetical protein